MIEEQIDFNHSVEAVVDWVNKNSSWDETLVIVIADHETSYLWGPNSNPEFKPIVNNGIGVMPGMKFNSDIGGFGWHANSLVSLFAKGAGSILFHYFADKLDRARGAYLDNTDIFEIMKIVMK
jgi:alkaline phosphatase